MTIRYDRSVMAALAIAAIAPSAIANPLNAEDGSPALNPTAYPVTVDSTHRVTVAGLEAPDSDREVSPIVPSIEPTPSTVEPTELAAEASPVEEAPLPLNAIDTVSQRPSVRGLSDVQPTDWAFQALRNLIENYGCLDGFSDGSFRGNQPITRFEFAAGLSACLDAIVVGPDDIATVAQLQREFAAELNTRVEDLEARIEELRADQFSTTTRLFGQVIFGVQGRNANRADFRLVDGIPDTDDPGGGVVTFYSNAQLSLLTRLTPRSLLLLGLSAGQGSSLFDTGTNTATGLTNNAILAYESDTNYDLRLSDLTYRHLVTDNLAIILGASGVDPVSVFRGPNRYESAGQGPLSLFAQRNPIISVGNGGTGLGFDWQISDRFSLQGVYARADATNPNGTSLLSNDYVMGFQLTSSPTDSLNLAFNYLHAYTELGSLVAGFGIGDNQLRPRNQITGGDAPLKTNAFGLSANWDVNRRITLGGWTGYTVSSIPAESGTVETFNWMLFANFPDLFKEGNLGGIYIGQPPRIVSSNLPSGQNIPSFLTGGLGEPGGQPAATLHIEAFYRYELTEYLSITPGVIAIFDPSNAPGSEAITIGVIRTTFTF